MSRTILFLTALLSYLTEGAVAQQQKIDSLTSVFESQLPGSNRLTASKELTSLLARNDSTKAEFYILKGIELSEQLLDEESKLYFESQRGRVLLSNRQTNRALQLCEKILLKSKQMVFHSVTVNCYEILGKANYIEGNDSLTLFYMTKALKIHEDSGDQHKIAAAADNIGIVYSKQGKTEQALNLFNRSLKISEALKDKKGMARSLKKIGSIYGELGFYPKALLNFERSLKLSEDIGDKEATAYSLENIGMIYSWQGKYSKVLPYYEKSLRLKEALGDTAGIAKSLMIIGIMHDRKGHYANAISNYEKSLELMQKIGHKRGIASCWSNMALVNKKQGNYEIAISYYINGLNLMKELGNKRGVGNALNNIGTVHKELGDNVKALSYYKRSLIQSEEIGNKKGEINALVNIGLYYLRNLNKEDSALFYFDRVFDICKEMNFSNTMIKTSQTIGDWYTSQGQLPKALDFYYDALKIVEETRDTLGIASVYSTLAEVHEIQNNMEGALSYQQKALEQYQLLSHTSGIAKTKNLIAQVYITNKEYEKALNYTSQALRSYQQLQDSCKFSHSFLILGKAFSLLHKTDSARHYLVKGAQQGAKCNFDNIAAECYIELGKILSEPAMAFRAYQKAYNLAISSNDRKSIKEATAYLHPIYKQKGQYRKAYEVLNLYQASKDSLFNEENTRKLVQKEMEYAYSKEQQEKALLQQQQEAAQHRKLDRQKWFTYMFIGGFGAMLLIALAFYRNYRNKQKANVLLRKQKAELEDLDNLKSRLFANISHELRTPLTLISSPVDTLLSNDQEHSPATLEKLELVKRNSQNLKGLVDDILELSKLESNKIKLYEDKAGIEPFLRAVFSNFDSLANHLGIAYKIELRTIKDAWLLIDTGKLEKVLNNLLSNAIKHTSSGGTVTMQAHQGNGILCVSVHDTGQGIAKDDLPHIFDRFFQSKQPDAPIQGGTGIGLALSKELTHLMRGEISVESEVGKGSFFSIELPYQPVTVPDPTGSPEEEEVAEHINLGHLALTEIPDVEKQFKVLIVEDHPDMQQFVLGLLRSRYHIAVANNGKEALKVLAKEHIDLIVSDVMMAEMDGHALLKHLKNSEAYCHIPVIMLTALDSEDSKLNALTLGVDDYLTKPFSPQELLARTHNLLLRYEARQIADKLRLEESPYGELEGVAFYPDDNENQPIAVQETDLEWLEKVAEAIRKQLENPEFQMAYLADQFHMSERQLYRRMKKLTGMPPKKYQQEVALQKGRYLLEKQKYGNVTAICYSVGMSNVSRFSQLYEARFGKKPKVYFST